MVGSGGEWPITDSRVDKITLLVVVAPDADLDFIQLGTGVHLGAAHLQPEAGL